MTSAERLRKIAAELLAEADRLDEAEQHVAEVEGERSVQEPFRDHDLIDVSAAATRFGIPSDTIRLWLRTKGIGEKRGGRWLVSISLLRRHIRH